jgi:S-adenosylmethionine:tRNA ribosyltransferase-isomerase
MSLATAPTGEAATDWLRFALTPDLEAAEPPETRAGAGGRDDVRLLVSRGDAEPEHTTIADLPALLAPGDLLVINNSATLPASVDGITDRGERVEVHLSTALPTGLWLIEVREPGTGEAAASRPRFADVTGRTITLPAGASVTVVARYHGSRRLWLAVVDTGDGDRRGQPAAPEGQPLVAYLAAHGRAIRYRHVLRDWPIDAYQTVFATEPGSAEMPSAARAITAPLVTALVARGVGITPITLHTGVSSLEGHEQPYPERVRVPGATAARVNDAHRAGGRVIAVGTTVVRALEAAADRSGTVHPLDRWTDVVITPERGVRVVDGLLTGWHEPEASHLLMLEAIAGRPALRAAYRAAVAAGYRWHEFGDAHLILPEPAGRVR